MNVKAANKRFRIGAFWQAVLVVLAAYLFFDRAFSPLMPRSLMIQFMVIAVVGVLLYFSFDERRWAEFKAPILAVLREDRLAPVRWAFLVGLPLLVAYLVYVQVRPSIEPPVELRQVHPAPPGSLKVFGKTYDLGKLENPKRLSILERLNTDPDGAWQDYAQVVGEGRDQYYRNCYYCHGDLLDGTGPFAQAFNPLPINFQDVGTIAQLQEGFLFWRIATGGPGLPKERGKEGKRGQGKRRGKGARLAFEGKRGKGKRGKRGQARILLDFSPCHAVPASTSTGHRCTSCSGGTTAAPASSTTKIGSPTSTGCTRLCAGKSADCTPRC